MSARRSSPTQLNSSIASSEAADKNSAPLAKAARLGLAAFFATSGCFVDQRDLVGIGRDLDALRRNASRKLLSNRPTWALPLDCRLLVDHRNRVDVLDRFHRHDRDRRFRHGDSSGGRRLFSACRSGRSGQENGRGQRIQCNLGERFAQLQLPNSHPSAAA